jgi:hypothetical protein
MLKLGYEDVESFEEVWILSECRMRGECLPTKQYEPLLLTYKQSGRVASYLSRLLKGVPPESLKVILMEKMNEDMGRVYREVLDFLKVSDVRRKDFPKLNQRAYHRSKLISKFVNNTPEWILVANRRLKRIFGIEKTGVLAWLRARNLKQQKREVSSGMRSEQVSYSADEVRALEQIIGRRVPWKEFCYCQAKT